MWPYILDDGQDLLRWLVLHLVGHVVLEIPGEQQLPRAWAGVLGWGGVRGCVTVVRGADMVRGRGSKRQYLGHGPKVFSAQQVSSKNAHLGEKDGNVLPKRRSCFIEPAKEQAPPWWSNNLMNQLNFCILQLGDRYPKP